MHGNSLKNPITVTVCVCVCVQEQYFALRPELRSRDFGDISDRLAVRERLQCRSFKWYLDHVYPEMQLSSPQNKAQPAVFFNRGVKRPKVLQRGRVRERERHTRTEIKPSSNKHSSLSSLYYNFVNETPLQGFNKRPSLCVQILLIDTKKKYDTQIRNITMLKKRKKNP